MSYQTERKRNTWAPLEVPLEDFFFFFFFFFFAEIADGDTCSGWRDTDLKGPRWSFKVTVATYCSACVCVYVCVCVKQPADETSVWKHRCRAKVNEPRHPLSTSTATTTSSSRCRRLLACCAINKSAAALCVRRQRNYCKQTRRALKMTDRPYESVETMGTRSW